MTTTDPTPIQQQLIQHDAGHREAVADCDWCPPTAAPQPAPCWVHAGGNAPCRCFDEPPAPQPATPGETLDLDQIEARANAATSEPWHQEHIGTDTCVSIGDYGWVVGGPRAPEYDMDSEQGRADAEFIAHARVDVPQLVAEVRRARAERDFAQELRDRAAAVREHDRRQAERAILRWAADRAEASGVLSREEVVGQLRRWADELDAGKHAAPGPDPATTPGQPPEHAHGVQPDWCGYLVREAADALRQLGHTDLAQHVEDLERWHAAGNPEHLYGSEPGPVVYQLPAEPPEHVTGLWELRTGRRWERQQHGWCRDGKHDDATWCRWPWFGLLDQRGPLSTTPPAGTEAL